MGVEKNLSDALGIDYQPTSKEVIPNEVGKEVVTYEVPENLPDEDADYALVRSTLRNLITKGNDALDEIVHIAKQNESARGFEVVSNLIKTIGETSKDLYALQKQKKDLKEPDPASDPRKKNAESINVEQAVFVGSAAELLAAIKKKKEEDEKIIDG
jgi:predicted house-cleaning noncanonical NTP pyrophosphatase (MazG superfamily)